MLKLILCTIILSSAAVSATAQTNNGRFIERLPLADANKDGSVTKMEYLNYRSTQFQSLDRNHDGFLGAADAPPFMGAISSRTVYQMIAHFDRDRDNRVSRWEYENGPTLAFDQVDIDRNKVITPYEMRTARATSYRY